VVPSEQIIDIGRQARLECLTEDRDRIAITWMKDGRPLPNHPRIVVNRQTLQIFNLQRADYGMYQCFVTRGSQEAQASSELRLGGNVEFFSSAAEEEIAKQFFDVAERVLNFSILYTHYICGGVIKFRFCILGVKIWAKKCNINLAKSLVKILPPPNFFFCRKSL
jgi:hypothetical protein